MNAPAAVRGLVCSDIIEEIPLEDCIVFLESILLITALYIAEVRIGRELECLSH